MFKFVKESPHDTDTVNFAVKQLESKYGVCFPSLLSEYYRTYDGCKIKICIFRVDGYECEVSKIIPICGAGNTFEKIVDNDRLDGIISPNFFPLAANRGGDYYYWDRTTENVYLVLSDNIEHPFEICKSITHFFEILDNC